MERIQMDLELAPVVLVPPVMDQRSEILMANLEIIPFYLSHSIIKPCILQLDVDLLQQAVGNVNLSDRELQRVVVSISY